MLCFSISISRFAAKPFIWYNLSFFKGGWDVYTSSVLMVHDVYPWYGIHRRNLWARQN